MEIEYDNREPRVMCSDYPIGKGREPHTLEAGGTNASTT